MTTHDPELVELAAELLEDLDGNDLEVVARAVLDAITTSPRHALVKLPEPSEWVGPWSWPQWNNYPFVRIEAGDEDEDIVLGTNQEHTPYRINPTEARHVAAALLAAARHAESGSTAPENKE